MSSLDGIDLFFSLHHHPFGLSSALVRSSRCRWVSVYFSLHHFNAPIILNRLWNAPFCYFLDVYLNVYADYLEISHWCKCTLKSNFMLFIFCLSWRQPLRQSLSFRHCEEDGYERQAHHSHMGVLVITPSHSQTTGDVALDLASPGGKEACNLPALNWYTRGAKIPRIQLALDLGLVNWPLGFKINSA